MVKSLFFILAVAFVGCGNGTRIKPEGHTVVVGDSFSVQSGDCALNNGILSGTCTITSAAGLGGVDSEKSLDVAFRLPEAGSIIFHAFSLQAKNGVDIQFRRSLNRLEVKVTVGGNTSDYSAKFATIDASQELAFQIDVHNSEEPTHLLIWDAKAGPGFAEAAALVNSKCSVNGSTDCHNWGTAHGGGDSLFVSLTNASLVRASVGGVKYQH